MARLRSDADQRIGQGVFDRLRGIAAQDGAMAAVIGQELVQHFIGGHERHPAERTHRLHDLGVPSVLAVGEGDPIDRIGEDAPHGIGGRLGVP
jgi:hypothetical protein